MMTNLILDEFIETVESKDSILEPDEFVDLIKALSKTHYCSAEKAGLALRQAINRMQEKENLFLPRNYDTFNSGPIGGTNGKNIL